MTEHALNHRFRRLRAQVVIVREGRGKGLDPKNICADADLPGTIDTVDTKSMPSPELPTLDPAQLLLPSRALPSEYASCLQCTTLFAFSGHNGAAFLFVTAFPTKS